MFLRNDKKITKPFPIKYAPPGSINTIEYLPIDVWTHLLKFTDPNTVAAIARVSKRSQYIAYKFIKNNKDTLFALPHNQYISRTISRIKDAKQRKTAALATLANNLDRSHSGSNNNCNCCIDVNTTNIPSAIILNYAVINAIALACAALFAVVLYSALRISFDCKENYEKCDVGRVAVGNFFLFLLEITLLVSTFYICFMNVRPTLFCNEERKLKKEIKQLSTQLSNMEKGLSSNQEEANEAMPLLFRTK